MLETVKLPFKLFRREPSLLLWMLVFPLVMLTIYMFMFAGFSTGGSLRPTPVAVVADAAWDGTEFSRAVDKLGEAGSADQLLDVHRVDGAADGEELLASHDVAGMLAMDAEGGVHLTLAPTSGLETTSVASIDRQVLEAVASAAAQTQALVEEVAEQNPAALADAAVVERSLGLAVSVGRVSLTRANPSEDVRFYYAFLGLTALLSAQLAAREVCRAQANTSALGARRCASGMSHARQLVGLLIGCWGVAWLCLAVAFAYTRFVVGVDFAGREGLALVGLGAAALLATACGALVGALPLRGGVEIRTSVLMGCSVLLGILAGMVGTPSMELSDALAQAVPATTWINPARLVSDMLYSLYYYDSLAPFALRAAACAGIALALFAAGAAIMGRNRYEQL